MNTKRSPQRRTAVFVGELTVDAVVVDPTSPPGTPKTFERSDEGDDQWLTRLDQLANAALPLEFHPGGSIANVAAAFARTVGPRIAFVAVSRPNSGTPSWPMWWPGYSMPALDLTARGISVYGRDAYRTSPEIPACLATCNTAGSVTSLRAREQTKAAPLTVLGDLLVIRSDHLTLLQRTYVRSFGTLAVLLADDGSGLEDALGALGGATQGWLFGRKCQIEALTISQRDLRSHVSFVGTSGAEAVYIATPDGELTMPVAPVQVAGSELGAGDAYMGGFLHMKLNADADDLTAHMWACDQAVAVLSVKGARTGASNDLNTIFPAEMARRSRSDSEGLILSRVHRSPGIAIVTGGQTGVDELAVHEAARAGLATHVVMPEGRRREEGSQPDDYESLRPYVRVHELSSESFRYRTWAAVYVSDVVLLLDYTGGEGSRETRRAAAILNRPLLEVADEALTSRQVEKWLATTAPESVLIAGSRESLLRASGQFRAAEERIRLLVHQLLLCARSREKVGDPTESPTGRGQRVVISRPLWESPYVRKFLEDIGISADPILLSPRDVARALETGLTDLGVYLA
ncbi:MAG: hypothetical protein LC776_00710 [Acidobacteria bacterium]|nr:hypothetical protein [Acidobacteriota bacterium]